MPVRWPVSRVLSRSAGMVIHLGRRLPDASCGRPENEATRPCAARATRALLFGLAPGRACPFHPARPKPRPTRLCGAGPRLAADGSYPLPCVVVLGLSSGDGLPRHTRPSSHLTGRWTLAPTVRHGQRPPCRQAADLDAPDAGRTGSCRPVHIRDGSSRPVHIRDGSCRPQAGSGRSERIPGPVGRDLPPDGKGQPGARGHLAATLRPGTSPPGGRQRRGRRGQGWPVRPRPCWWRAARGWRSSARTRPTAPWPRPRAHASSDP